MSSVTTAISWLPGKSRDRRILAIAIALLLAVIIAAIVLVPVVMLHRYYDDHLGRMTRQLKTQSALNASRPELARALDTLRANNTRKLFLHGATPALAAAELQDQVKQAIESVGGRVALVQGIAPKDDGAYRIVAAQFHLNVSNSNLRRVLHALETREPYFFIDNLTVRALVPPGYRPPPGAAEPEVFVQMDVSGVTLVAEITNPPAASPATGTRGAEGNRK